MLTQYDIEDVQKHVGGKFSQREIAALYARFCALDRNSKGYISADEFMAIPEFAVNPLAQRLLRHLEGVNFKDFCQWLSAFSSRATAEDRTRLIFQVFDQEETGSISREAIVALLRDLSGNFMTEEQREQVVARALQEVGFNQDRLLTFEDFRLILGSDIPMSVEIPLDD
eukprot:TRINITY_DN2416_c0_g1_i2.p1 TRINITY_DN2416_c0_g1~~TRINITY_DN2416_c0_g1_i2.p1  ORF type:complete len:170 (+),score=37.88 TRINITY_DN2416_c0_g1_i2:49-558(+)